jgi:hypothetical protein
MVNTLKSLTLYEIIPTTTYYFSQHCLYDIKARCLYHIKARCLYDIKGHCLYGTDTLFYGGARLVMVAAKLQAWDWRF